MRHLRAAALGALLLFHTAPGLDNGLRLPPMSWSSWYGFTSNIDEALFHDVADGLVSSGLAAAGFTGVWMDDGYALPRDPATHKVTVDPLLFPSGMRNLSDYMRARGLSLGVYTSVGPLTCLGYQPSQPKRPGSCGFEALDAETYAVDWAVSQVKDDGCGSCPAPGGFAAMRDALNATGRRVLFTIGGYNTATPGGEDFGAVANLWRVGPDLYSSAYDMWTNRLDIATTTAQLALLRAGSFPDPDFLEVGYSPRATKGSTQSALEQRSMFTMWAALPTGLTLSADVRAGRGGLDSDALATLTNAEVIAVNQDALVAPLRLIANASGLQVWARPLASGATALVFFHRGVSTAGPLPAPPAVREISVAWADVGIAPAARVAVRDLWARADLGAFSAGFAANVTQRDARLYTFTVVG
jgi:alpha-galactosidase